MSSDGRNFFLKHTISNPDTFLETWGNNICENHPKIPILSGISHVEAKRVKKCAASSMAARLAS